MGHCSELNLTAKARARAHLRFEHAAGGKVAVKVLKVHGPPEVVESEA